MTKAIYKVTSKKTTELLEAEVKRRDKYMPAIIRKVKKLMPEVLDISYSDDPWNGERRPGCLVFKPEFEKTIDKNIWKHIGYVHRKGKSVKTWWPKRNVKGGKQLALDIAKLMPREKFFQSTDILEAVGYKPKNRTEKVTPTSMTFNTFGVGYKKKKDGMMFVFQGYDGYKEPRGVKEMLMSEYNKEFDS